MQNGGSERLGDFPFEPTRFEMYTFPTSSASLIAALFFFSDSRVFTLKKKTCELKRLLPGKRRCTLPTLLCPYTVVNYFTLRFITWHRRSLDSIYDRIYYNIKQITMRFHQNKSRNHIVSIRTSRCLPNKN